MSLKRKPRSDSPLESLLPKQKDALEQWLLGNMGYGKAAALVEKQFGIVTSETAIGRFWQSYVSPRRLVRRQRSAQLADQMVEEIASKPGQWDGPLKDALKETAFNLLQQPNPSTEDVMFIMGCVAKSKDQELKEETLKISRGSLKLAERRVVLLERKMEKATAKLNELRDPKKADTAEARQAILDEVDRIMGLKKT